MNREELESYILNHYAAQPDYWSILEEETDGLYMLDILRGGIQNDDPRIPRNVSK